MQRRKFLKIASTGVGVTLMPSIAALAAKERGVLTGVSPLPSLAKNTTRTWLGESYWANRLQDWQLNNGRMECLKGGRGYEVRTVSILTRSLNDKHEPARIQAKFGQLDRNQGGFAGFLLGVGEGKLDYRASALAQRASGTGGGFMAVISADGELSFRDFTGTNDALKFENLTGTGKANIGSIQDKEILLDCHIDPVNDGKFDVRLIATDAMSQKELGFIVRTGVDAQELVGGMMLLSSPPSRKPGTRWWISDVATGGGKVDADESRQLGPVIGCMHSLNRTTMKMTAQFMPVDLTQCSKARLDYRIQGKSEWTKGPVSQIEVGFVALFRVDTWNPDKTYEYRIVCPHEEERTLYDGLVVKDPGDARELKVALYSCVIPTAKSLDAIKYERRIPEERQLGRYTKDNIFFPHNEIRENCDSHDPDLYVFVGDQYYETYPTRWERESPEVKTDTLYRWYLWYWSFRDSVRNRPCIVLADDHDILQGNVWGNSGNNSDMPKEEQGGYKYDKSMVRMVFRMQQGHNPDAYDPTPIKYDIPVSYGSFVYGGTSFAVIEDRKFKSPVNDKIDPKKATGSLLGERQEAFLKEWAKMDKGLPKVCVTASVWGSPQAVEKGEALLDYDANGYPFDGRTRAVKLLKDAGAIGLAGDMHLATLSRQGINDYEDGPLFFAGPAIAAFWQRWFYGWNKLENQRDNNPNTGNFIDSFGNKMRVLAVANPKISYENFSDEKKNNYWGNFLDDRALKSEGYGIVRVNHKMQYFELECWPWDVDPDKGEQFEGWPYVSPFEKPIS